MLIFSIPRSERIHLIKLNNAKNPANGLGSVGEHPGPTPISSTLSKLTQSDVVQRWVTEPIRLFFAKISK